MTSWLNHSNLFCISLFYYNISQGSALLFAFAHNSPEVFPMAITLAKASLWFAFAHSALHFAIATFGEPDLKSVPIHIICSLPQLNTRTYIYIELETCHVYCYASVEQCFGFQAYADAYHFAVTLSFLLYLFITKQTPSRINAEYGTLNLCPSFLISPYCSTGKKTLQLCFNSIPTPIN